MKVGDLADRHRDVVLDAGADMLLRLDHRLADAPQLARLRRARGDRAVRDEARLKRGGEEAFERVRAGRYPAWLDDISSSTYQACGAASGSCTPGMCAIDISMPKRGISSKAVS